MSTDSHQSGESAALRHRAEKRLKRQATEVAGTGSAVEMQRLVHELQVHQIELEMQNEELLESRAQMESALERYTDLYDFAPVGYFTLSADGTIREVNLPGARLLGLERTRLVGGRFGTFVSENTRPIFDIWLEEVFATQAKQVCAVGLVKEGLPPLTVEIEATLSVDGREGRAVVVDVTARKALEEQLRQAQKMEVVGQLAGGVAHDFNNILAAMLLNLEMMQMQDQLSMKVKSSLHDLETLATRAASLTRQLLLFSRQQAMHPEKLEINAALTHLLNMLNRLLGEDITCLSLPSTRELWVEADAAMLDQAMMNLCLNARDAMPNGGTLTLETSLAEFNIDSAQIQPEARPGQFVCLRISDTGCGMNADVLKHLFEPFFTTKETGKGTGLGLASVHGIVHQHKGWLNVESVVGQGASFRLYLPLSGRAETTPRETSSLPPFKGRNETILLVEDEAALLVVSARALTLFGYRVLSATNGQEALSLWEQHQDAIDLVLTDMRMPQGISGLELAEKLWKTKPSLKVIIMSGYSMKMVRNSTVANDGYTFLAKPFDLKTLSETVRHCLD
ncbi:MAG TPA: ATP-binding protein [Candidatus Methylacidiphilales bacterium]|jgi:signal transduction histidine kinase|nr:ATP-binding protein [Candidatus Methylacidiphilales bacterium]